MKRFIACTLFFILLMWIGITTSSGNACVLTPATEVQKTVEAGQAPGDKLSAVVISSGWADISLQQSNTLNGQHTGRRIGQPRLIFETVFAGFADICVSVTPSFYKIFLYHFREYSARQRQAGYYIYTLCKIII